MNIHNSDSQMIWHKSAQFLADSICLYHNIGQKTLVLLSGGSVVKLYPYISAFLKKTDLDMKFLSIAQVDERLINQKSPQELLRNSTGQAKIKNQEYKLKIKNNINAEIIRETGLWNACKDRKIPYFLISQEKTLIESAKEYNQVIEKLFKQYIYKLAVLGIGEDGHTAGLAPGHKSSWQKEELVVGYRNEGKFPQRITLTPNALLQLDQAIVVVSGKRKKQIVSTILDKRNLSLTNKYPAVILHSIPKVDLFVDFG